MPIATSRPPRLAASLLVAACLAVGGALTPLTAQPATAIEPPAPGTSERLAGSDRFATAVAISTRLFPSGGAPVVYLAAGLDFPDALAAGPAASREGGAVLLTRPTFIPPVVEAELVRLAPPRVVVAGGPSVVSDAVLARVSALLPATSVERTAGADRFATAAALSARVFLPGTTLAFIASGLNFPDALAAAPIAADLGAPVLLTRPDQLPGATAAELVRLGATNAVVVGGPSVVGDSVVSQLGALGIAVERVAGSTRFDTAAAVTARFRPDAATHVVATGMDYPDALAAVPLAAALDAPISLVFPESVPAATRDAMIAGHPSALVVVGGPGAVGRLVPPELTGWADGRISIQPPGPGYPSFDSRYHDYGEMVIAIRTVEILRPDLVQVFSIGQSYEGRELWAAKISDNVAIDEAEPEVLVDALHHAREHLTVEQAIYLLRVLVLDYDTDATVQRLVNERETFIVFALNPDGWAYDLTGSPYVGWRKNREPNPGSGHVGVDLNRNYDYLWGCCNGSSGNPAAWNYRGPAPFSATEARVLRDFVNGRVVGGVQQIRTHVTLHTNGELILYPFGYTKTDIPADMAVDDWRTFVAMAQAMAASNGYRAMQSSDLYVTDGDQIDWMYARHRIFSFTFELYPTEQVSSHADHEPPDEVIAAQTARNRGALLYLIDLAACPYAAAGMASAYC